MTDQIDNSNYEKDLDKILRLSRYAYRTYRINTVLDQDLKKTKRPVYEEMLCLYLSLLYVTIETYKEFKISDLIIDYLIGDKYNNYLDELRLLRNSIFHPNKDFNDNREINYYKSNGKVTNWAFIVDGEINRYIAFFPEINNQYDKAIEYKQLLRRMNSWIPIKDLPIKAIKVKKNIYNLTKKAIMDNPEKISIYIELLKSQSEIIDNEVIKIYRKLLE